jgi:vacuolar-type H+-ATPase subunit H
MSEHAEMFARAAAHNAAFAGKLDELVALDERIVSRSCTLVGDVSELTDELAAAVTRLAARDAAIARRRDEAEQEAGKIIAEANQSALSIVGDAHRSAEQIIREAREAAAAEARHYIASKIERERELGRLDVEIFTRQKALAEIDEQAAALRGRLGG